MLPHPPKKKQAILVSDFPEVKKYVQKKQVDFSYGVILESAQRDSQGLYTASIWRLLGQI